ncbi:MAG: OadG family transporter subunit, partial [Eubacteriales bacterium]|nr:OadG family transporter subunit [Eubacteriales bacterium]
MNTFLKVLADNTTPSGREPLWKIENFGDAALFSLICIVLVFVVLIVIALVIALMNKIPGLEDKPHATMKDGTE